MSGYTRVVFPGGKTVRESGRNGKGRRESASRAAEYRRSIDSARNKE